MFESPIYETDLGVKIPYLPLTVKGTNQNGDIISEDTIKELVPDFVLSFYQPANMGVGCPKKGIKARILILIFKPDLKIFLDFPSPFAVLDFSLFNNFTNIIKVDTQGEQVDDWTLGIQLKNNKI